MMPAASTTTVEGVTLEVQLPVRNPTGVMRRTIQSLLSQTHRNFTVTLSDNHSTGGLDEIENAESVLTSAGLTVRKVRPPQELDRVGHWNWLHARADAAWIKPLFVGDWLEPACLARLGSAISDSPPAGLAHVAYRLHREGMPPQEVLPAAPPGFRSPACMQDAVLRYGHQFGPPSAYAFSSDAFRAVGGYRPTLPIVADCLFCCTVAATYGVVTVPKILANFFIHSDRFSKGLAARKKAIAKEKITYLLLLVYHAWTERQPIPWRGVGRMAAREIRDYINGE